jgi:hypothetical protein
MTGQVDGSVPGGRTCITPTSAQTRQRQVRPISDSSPRLARTMAVNSMWRQTLQRGHQTSTRQPSANISRAVARDPFDFGSSMVMRRNILESPFRLRAARVALDPAGRAPEMQAVARQPSCAVARRRITSRGGVPLRPARVYVPVHPSNAAVFHCKHHASGARCQHRLESQTLGAVEACVASTLTNACVPSIARRR